MCGERERGGGWFPRKYRVTQLEGSYDGSGQERGVTCFPTRDTWRLERGHPVTPAKGVDKKVSICLLAVWYELDEGRGEDGNIMLTTIKKYAQQKRWCCRGDNIAPFRPLLPVHRPRFFLARLVWLYQPIHERNPLSRQRPLC